MTRVNRLAVPDRARELAALERVDYADCFTVAVSTQHAPEEWIRRAAESKPALFTAVRVGHHALGLRLASADSPEHVIGWDVLGSGPGEAVLGNESWFGRARIVGLTPPGQLVVATLVTLNGVTGQTLWAVAAPIHRAVARYALNVLSTLTTEYAWSRRSLRRT